MKNDDRPCGCERLLRGVALAPGIAIGRPYVMEAGLPPVPDHRIDTAGVEAELLRLDRAIEMAQRQIRKLKRKAELLPPAAAEELSILLDAHGAMLSGSRLIRGARQRVIDNHENAAAAVQHEIYDIARQFEEMDDRYLAARAVDIRDAGGRLIQNLLNRGRRRWSVVPAGSLVFADELTPEDIAQMEPGRVIGFATMFGGPEGHIAVMARSLGIPAVAAVPRLTDCLADATLCIIDGVRGEVVIDPSDETIARYRREAEILADDRHALTGLVDLPAVTLDGVDIELMANVEPQRGVEAAMAVGAAGIGLLRTEFLYMDSETPPDEMEQTIYMSALVKVMKGRPVTMRTLDAGGDKLASGLGHHLSETCSSPLGLRGIRLSRRWPELMEAQLGAALRASIHGPVRILLPMIISIEEIRWARQMLADVAARLRRDGVAIADQLPPMGIMVEVPGAALSADALALESDFFSIGTNDLTQYTLALDRADDQIADLFDSHHPALWRLIQFTVEAAIRANIPVSVCGELAGDPHFVPLLIGLGVRNLSMSPMSLPAVKRCIRHLRQEDAQNLAHYVMFQHDAARIRAALMDFAVDGAGFTARHSLFFGKKSIESLESLATVS
jgi:phosphotransferase system enzyme I (PtsI)